MATPKTTYTLLEKGMILNIQKPEPGLTSGLSLLLHGWTGDENSMKPFWGYMPKEHWILAPRAPQPAKPSGYGWSDIVPNVYPNYNQFLPSVENLIQIVTSFRKENGLLQQKMNVIGFSQGAAVAYMLAALIPQEIDHLIPIAGFMPEGTLPILQNQPYRSNKIHIIHGVKDKLVPMAMAQQIDADLKSIGYETELCLDENAGHSLGSSCVEVLKSLQ
jgi:predicted esterase